MKWRPIRTAPKNGYILLKYKPNPFEDRNYVHEGTWIDVPHINEIKNPALLPKTEDVGHWEVGYVAVLSIGGAYNGQAWEARSMRIEPTHWMPLPNATKNKSKKS